MRWGSQLLRISSDMMVVCDDELVICHHNRAFLKAVGHTEGSFAGQGFAEFFPAEDRAGVIEAFDDWKRGHAAGMRFQARLLSTRGGRLCEFRAVRSRDRHGRFFYYLVARDATESRRGGREEEVDRDPFFKGLPVAAWRTDGELRITQVYGSLWPELGVASEDLVGEVFGRRHDTLLPGVLLGIDCSDTLAGMTLQTLVGREGASFNVTVEPFVDSAGRVMGTVGLLRRALPDQALECLRATSSRPQPRHHSPPEGAMGGISIVTGRVPKFRGGADETSPLLPESGSIAGGLEFQVGRS